jgi:anti-sigma factor RsiW
MRCDVVRKKLDRLRGPEVSPRLRERIEAHLEQCAECRQAWERQRQLASLLKNAPAPPPVPGGFADRLLAAARQRQAERLPAPASLGRGRWSLGVEAAGRRAAQAAVLAGGLLIGLLMGQQTWCSVYPSSASQAGQTAPVVGDELDYLTDAPGSSLAESYLMLTRTADNNGA